MKFAATSVLSNITEQVSSAEHQPQQLLQGVVGMRQGLHPICQVATAPMLLQELTRSQLGRQ